MNERTSYTQSIVYLRNGVKQGNPNKNARRCCAKAKSTGKPCLGMALRDKKRCRLHGGKSTGPKTQIGRDKCCNARKIHGLYSKRNMELLFLASKLILDDQKHNGKNLY